MFDVGFWELTIIGIVALLVIGPERLPGVARTAGLWFGKIRGFVGSVKADIDKELRADELKRILEKQNNSIGLHDIIEETEETLKQIQQPEYLVKSPDNARFEAQQKTAAEATQGGSEGDTPQADSAAATTAPTTKQDHGETSKKD